MRLSSLTMAPLPIPWHHLLLCFCLLRVLPPLLSRHTALCGPGCQQTRPMALSLSDGQELYTSSSMTRPVSTTYMTSSPSAADGVRMAVLREGARTAGVGRLASSLASSLEAGDRATVAVVVAVAVAVAAAAAETPVAVAPSLPRAGTAAAPGSAARASASAGARAASPAGPVSPNPTRLGQGRLSCDQSHVRGLGTTDL